MIKFNNKGMIEHGADILLILYDVFFLILTDEFF